MESAARSAFGWEDVCMRDLRKRARSLSLEMKSDMDGEQVCQYVYFLYM